MASLNKAVLVMLTGTLVYVLAVVQRMSPPVVAVEVMNELGLNPADLSLMFALTMIGYGLMQPLAGFWADRFGPRRCLIVTAVTLGLGSLAFSLSSGLIQGLLSRTLVGAAAGLAMMSCLKLGGNWFSPRQFGLVSSCVVASSALSNFLVGRPLVAATEAIGWRGSFGALGLAGLGLGLIIFLLVKDRPSGGRAGPRLSAPAAPEPRPDFWSGLALIVKTPAFWLLGVLYGCTDMIYACFTGLWAGPYLMEAYGQSEAAVGNMLSLSAVGFLAAPPLWVILARLLNSYAKVIFIITLLNVAVAIVLVTGPALGPGGLYLLCLAAPAGAQVAGMYFVLVSRLFPANMAAFSMGLTNVFAIIPGAVMQKIVGNIMTAGGEIHQAEQYRAVYGQAFSPLLICMVFSVALAVWLIKKDGGQFES